MPRWIKLATLLVAIGLLVLGFVLPWFAASGDGEWVRVHLDALPIRGGSGLMLDLCDRGGCVTMPTGRLPGGFAWLESFVVHASIGMLAISAYLVGRDQPYGSLGVWSVGTSGLVLLLALLVVFLFDGPRGMSTSTGAGAWVTIAGAFLGALGQTRVFDLLEPDLDEVAWAPLPVARALAAAPAVPRLKTPATAPAAGPPATPVRAGEFAFAGLRLATAEGDRRIAWEELTRIRLVGLNEVFLELTTAGGDVLRITTASRIDYRFLPGGPAATDAENLRRLHAFAKQRNPSLT